MRKNVLGAILVSWLGLVGCVRKPLTKVNERASARESAGGLRATIDNDTVLQQCAEDISAAGFSAV